uniref:Uncharacterized protein n=1 Tax=Vitiosangium cumulatum TaxID=1867796 RepID=A0A7D4XUU4_9BACT|nr:hypothetical protein [Vitiosangium cumulatum]
MGPCQNLARGVGGWMADLEEQRGAVRNVVDEHLLKVNGAARRYRKLNTVLLLIAVIFGGVGTLFAGVVAAGGGPAKGVTKAVTGEEPKSELPETWRKMCLWIAVLTGIGTLSSGMNGQLRIAEQQSRAMACAGHLDSLKLDLLVDTDFTEEDLNRIKDNLSKVLREYPDYFR